MTRLSGKRILVTRAREQAAELCERLEALGAIPVVFPTIAIAPLDDPSALDRVLTRLHEYDWVIFTSVNGVKAVWARMAVLGHDSVDWSDVRVAAIGPATKRALETRGVHPEFIPEEYVAEAIAAGIGDVSGQRVLLPRADIAREALAVELDARGAQVEEVAAYRTLPAEPGQDALEQIRIGMDAATFTSASTVRNFVLLLGDEAMRILERVPVVCIGPITAQAARDAGIRVDMVAREYTLDGLIEALGKTFSESLPA